MIKNNKSKFSKLALMTLLGGSLLGSGCAGGIGNGLIADPAQNRAAQNYITNTFMGEIINYGAGEFVKKIDNFLGGGYREPELMAYNFWKDNGDKIIDESELVGLNKNSYDLDKEPLFISVWSRDYQGTVLVRSWKDNGELIGKTIMYLDKNNVKWRASGPKSPTQGDFMDNIKGAGTGSYVITADFENGIKKATEIFIISNLNNSQ